MRLFLILLLVFLYESASAQTLRVEIEGEIKVPEGTEAEGITIFNKTSSRGTVASEDGKFRLEMAEGDSLFFSALQFQDLGVVVDREMVTSGHLNVEIAEGLNQLPEVVISPHELSGNLAGDAKNIEVVEVNLPSMSAGELNEYDWNFTPDAQSKVSNAAMGTYGGRLTNAASLLAILGRAVSYLIPKRTRGLEKKPLERDKYSKIRLERILRETYGNLFFEENLNIPAEEVAAFIWFCDNNGFDEQLLEEKKELDLLQYFFEQREDYFEWKKERGE